MSNLSMSKSEEKALDSKVEQMMDLAKTRQAEAEQLAMDSARLMACTTDRLDKLQNQGFFKRCWNRFSGKAGAMERVPIFGYCGDNFIQIFLKINVLHGGLFQLRRVCRSVRSRRARRDLLSNKIPRCERQAARVNDPKGRD